MKTTPKGEQWNEEWSIVGLSMDKWCNAMQCCNFDREREKGIFFNFAIPPFVLIFLIVSHNNSLSLSLREEGRVFGGKVPNRLTFFFSSVFTVQCT